jgi:hypothetical protein
MRTPFELWRFVVVADDGCLGLALNVSARRFLCCLHNGGNRFDQVGLRHGTDDLLLDVSVFEEE